MAHPIALWFHLRHSARALTINANLCSEIAGKKKEKFTQLKKFLAGNLKYFFVPKNTFKFF